MTDGGTTGVVTLPARHPYVDAVVPLPATGVRHVRLDPRPAAGDGWQPEPMWQPDLVRSLPPDVDVVHAHFGFDHVAPVELAAWVDAVHGTGRLVAVTVHDLRNPHHDSRGRLDAQYAVLLPAADAVLTLTDGAAREIADRHGVRATVTPHPRVLDGPTAPTREGLVGIHLKSLRRNVVDPAGAVAAVAAATSELGAELVVTAHRDRQDHPAVRAVAAVLQPHDRARLVLHEPLDDAALQDHLSGLHVSVMVNRWGTHSGWLEACRDVGTTVVAPDCGYYAEQWDAVVGYRTDEATGPDAGSLSRGVRRALASAPPAPADAGWRAGQLTGIRAAHEALYRRLAAGRGRAA